MARDYRSCAPPAQPAYLSQQPAYPSQQPAYLSQQPAYSSQQPAYPSQQPAYPSQLPAYSSQQPAYPSHRPAYAQAAYTEPAYVSQYAQCPRPVYSGELVPELKPMTPAEQASRDAFRAEFCRVAQLLCHTQQFR
jgi:hypothetical protein